MKGNFSLNITSITCFSYGEMKGETMITPLRAASIQEMSGIEAVKDKYLSAEKQLGEIVRKLIEE